MTLSEYLICIGVALLLSPLLAIGSWFFFPLP